MEHVEIPEEPPYRFEATPILPHRRRMAPIYLSSKAGTRRAARPNNIAAAPLHGCGNLRAEGNQLRPTLKTLEILLRFSEYSLVKSPYAALGARRAAAIAGGNVPYPAGFLIANAVVLLDGKPFIFITQSRSQRQNRRRRLRHSRVAGKEQQSGPCVILPTRGQARR